MRKIFYTLTMVFCMVGSFAKANDVITQTLQSDRILQLTVMTRYYCNAPKATLTLVTKDEKAVVYKLELIPTNKMLCDSGSKELSVELSTPSDLPTGAKLIIITGANVAYTEQE